LHIPRAFASKLSDREGTKEGLREARDKIELSSILSSSSRLPWRRRAFAVASISSAQKLNTTA
jgi:hypothetical protein